MGWMGLWRLSPASLAAFVAFNVEWRFKVMDALALIRRHRQGSAQSIGLLLISMSPACRAACHSRELS